MLLTGEIQITYVVYRKMALSSYGIRPNIGRALPLLFIALGVGQALFVAEPDTPFLPMGLVFLVIPAFFELLVVAIWALRRKAFAEPVRYRFTTTGMTELTASGRTDVPWSKVARVDRWPSTWIVRFGGGQFLRIPRKALTMADRRTLNDFFLAHPEFAG